MLLLFSCFFQSLEKLSKQQLNDGDVVLVLEKIYAGRRAVILNTRGVPGLDKIRYLFYIFKKKKKSISFSNFSIKL